MKLILLGYQNNVRHSSVTSNAASSNQLEHRLRNYFDNPTKLFSDLYLVKFLGALAKLFFPCKQYYIPHLFYCVLIFVLCKTF